LQRPLDDQSQIRVRLETEAVLAIISLCESGEWEMISSEALLFEVNRNTNTSRKEIALGVLQTAKSTIALDQEIKDRAAELVKDGVKPLDALHLASAEKAQVDFFCTCDDKLIKKAKVLCESKLKIRSPIQLVEEIEQ
jgi:predicted nucleic acid-binding protein